MLRQKSCSLVVCEASQRGSLGRGPFNILVSSRYELLDRARAQVYEVTNFWITRVQSSRLQFDLSRPATVNAFLVTGRKFAEKKPCDRNREKGSNSTMSEDSRDQILVAIAECSANLSSVITCAAFMVTPVVFASVPPLLCVLARRRGVCPRGWYAGAA